MKKVIALILSAGLFLGAQVASAESIAIVDMVKNPNSQAGVFSGDRGAVVDLTSPALVQVGQEKVDSAAIDFMAMNHDLIPEKVEAKEVNPMFARFSLDSSPHNLFYLSLLD